MPTDPAPVQGSLFGGDPTRGDRFSPCGLYRYRLWEVWDPAVPPAVFLLMNPSIASRVKPDHTFTICRGFARRWGAGGVELGNAMARVYQHPEDLEAFAASGGDAVGPENAEHLRAMLSGAREVVIAWGEHPLVRLHGPAALALVPEDVPLLCLGRTKGGVPRHPARLGYATEREALPRGEAFGTKLDGRRRPV